MSTITNKNIGPEKLKAIDMAMKQIDKAFGKGSLNRMGDMKIMDIEAISTGSIGLDHALGIGGIPKGRIIEIFGPESSSKTTTALHCAAECQKQNGVVAFIDAEHALDPKYAKSIGVDVDNMLLSQPDYGEQALDIVDTLARSGGVDLIIIDSVAALTPKVELEGEMSDQQVGVQARLMSKALRKLTGVLHKTNTTVIFINQIRMKIGTMGYGSPETTTGGNALKFYASVRIDVRRSQTLKKGDNPVGIMVKAKVIKNKVAPPFMIGVYEVGFGTGIARDGEVIDYGVKFDLIDKAGAWFSFTDNAGLLHKAQGKDKMKELFKANPEVYAEISEKVINKVKNLVPDYESPSLEEVTELDSVKEEDSK